MFCKRFTKFRMIFIEKGLNILKTKVFEQLSIFNEAMIIYRKTQKVKKKKDLTETIKYHEKMG